MTISVLMGVSPSEDANNLDHAIQSIWTDQTLKPTQVILVKDGALGNDLEHVISKWENIISDRILIISNKQNIGLTKSLNIGIKQATGDYIARMDSDDISMPYRFEHQVKFLENHPDIVIVGGHLQEFNSDNENLGIRKYPLDNSSILKYIHKACPLAHPAVMMRRKIFENGIHYDERYRTCQDIALWFDVLVAGYKIANLDEVTIKFRRDGSIYKRRNREKGKYELRIYSSGIKRLYGLCTIKYIYPVARYLFRMMPERVVKAVYGSKFRTLLLQSKKNNTKKD